MLFDLQIGISGSTQIEVNKNETGFVMKDLIFLCTNHTVNTEVKFYHVSQYNPSLFANDLTSGHFLGFLWPTNLNIKKIK